MGSMNPFSGLGASQPDQSGQGQQQFDPSNIVGSSPEGAQAPGSEQKDNGVDEIVRKELANLAKLKDDIESMSKRFPGAAANLRSASEFLNKALGDIVKQMRTEEKGPKTAM